MIREIFSRAESYPDTSLLPSRTVLAVTWGVSVLNQFSSDRSITFRNSIVPQTSKYIEI